MKALLLTLMLMGAAYAEEGPKWKIVVTLDGPPGKQELTYGTKQDGPRWFKDRDACEAARKGGDKDFAKTLASLKKTRDEYRKQGLPVDFTTACRTDSSI